MNLKDIQMKLYERLKPSGWADKLKMFILSQEFLDILNVLYKDAANGKRFTPVLKDIFKAFEECSYDKLKVIMIGQDPYPQHGVADGISFSCSYTGKEQPALQYILQEIEDTVYDGDYYRDVDLKRWSNQGVLMLNTGLTCEIDTVGSHTELWKPFITHLFEMLTDYNSGLVYVFLGNKAKELHTRIPNNNYKFFSTHPTAAAYRTNKKWNSGNLFNQVNVVLKKQNNETIIW
jgi:uracil-DNA glycosylase